VVVGEKHKWQIVSIWRWELSTTTNRMDNKKLIYSQKTMLSMNKEKMWAFVIKVLMDDDNVMVIICHKVIQGNNKIWW
jgi:hypothetical protein